MQYQAQRPSAVARRKRQARAQIIKNIIMATVSVTLAWTGMWLAYFATI